MSSQRILYLLPSLTTGGAEYQSVNQLNRLYEIGADVHLVVLSDEVPLLSQLTLPTDRTHIFGISGLRMIVTSTIPNIPKGMIKLKRLITRLSPDIVLAILPLSHLLARLVAPVTPKHRLWIYHRSMQYEANPLDSNGKRVVQYITRRLSDTYDYGHLYISEAVMENVSSHLPFPRHAVLHNAVPMKKVDASVARRDAKSRGITGWDYLVVIPGRIHPSKGQDFFISSVADILKKSTRRICVILVGGGLYMDQINSLIRQYQLESKVFITGMVNNEILLSYLKFSDLTVIPSVNEGFGNVAVEGLMQGATMLASDAGGLKEIIRDGGNGYIFRRLDREDLREQFQSIITFNQKIPAAKLHSEFLEKFTTAAQVKRLLSIITDDSIVGESKGA